MIIFIDCFTHVFKIFACNSLDIMFIFSFILFYNELSIWLSKRYSMRSRC
uniref:Uncharacterized protein n=1 Tax=Rhizophora mucronata TaxID=61149 RepID=A0A2P2IIB5_RHIMU